MIMIVIIIINFTEFLICYFTIYLIGSSIACTNQVFHFIYIFISCIMYLFFYYSVTQMRLTFVNKILLTYLLTYFAITLLRDLEYKILVFSQ